MEELLAELERLLARLQERADIELELEALTSVYPFNQYEYLITNLVGKGALSLAEYHRLRAAYIARNQYLPLFEINAPRGFGEGWAQSHVQGLVPELVKPARKLEPNFAGQYDLLLAHDQSYIRIEVKASRVVDFDSNASLVIRALASDTDKRFDMNFQQLKPGLCDIFIWLAVWRDKITYGVMAAREVESSRYYSPRQHRGNVGEGQLHLKRDNIAAFSEYETAPELLQNAIVAAYERQRA